MPDPAHDGPIVLDGSGRGPWIWRVRNRYLITASKLRPRDAGMGETRRCGIIADCPDIGTAVSNAHRRRAGINHDRMFQ